MYFKKLKLGINQSTWHNFDILSSYPSQLSKYFSISKSINCKLYKTQQLNGEFEVLLPNPELAMP